jgi:hypothetical protein
MPATYESIATTTLGSAQATVTFSSITGTYTDLVVIIGGSLAVADNPYIQFNSDTGSNYSRTQMSGDGSTAGSSRSTSATRIVFTGGDLETFNAIININNYSNTTTNKTALLRANSASQRTTATVGLWRSTSAITSITFGNNSGNNFASGTVFTIYGIKAA